MSDQIQVQSYTKVIIVPDVVIEETRKDFEAIMGKSPEEFFSDIAKNFMDLEDESKNV
jgi:hypothetical protein